MAHPRTSGTSNLDVLVLWRGTPGWFMKGGPAREHSSSDSLGRTTARMSRGGVDLELRFDARNRSAQVNLSGSPVRIQQALKRSKKLVSFLRCDVRLEDPKVQELMNRVCSQLADRKVGASGLRGEPASAKSEGFRYNPTWAAIRSEGTLASPTLSAAKRRLARRHRRRAAASGMAVPSSRRHVVVNSRS